MGYYTPDQRKESEGKIKEMEETLKQIPTSQYRTVRNLDQNAIKKKIQIEKDQLRKGTPPKVSTREQNKLFKEAKDIKETLRHSMPSKTVMMGKRVKVGENSYGRVADETTAYREAKRMKTQGHLERRYKEIMSTLDNSNSKVRNLENFRRGRG